MQEELMISNRPEIDTLNSNHQESEKLIVSHKFQNKELLYCPNKKAAKVGPGDEPLKSLNISLEIESNREEEQNPIRIQNSSTSLLKNQIYKEKSKFVNNLRMFILALGLYIFGYYVVITNVLGKVLTIEVYKMSKVASENRIGDFGSLHSFGGFISLILTGYLTNKFGRVKLMIFMELLGIINCFLHAVESMPLLLVLRFFDGFIGALNYSIIPSLIKELLPKRLAPIGANLSYTILVSFLFIASLMNTFYGGYEGLKENWKIIIAMPGFLGIFRLIFMLILFWGMESPAFYIDHFFKKKDVLKEKMLKVFKRIYIVEDAVKKTKDMIEEEERILVRLGMKERKKIDFKSLFTAKYKKRFILVSFLNAFQQLTGINFLYFFSTQLFDEISGNGAFMTILLTFGNFISSFLGIVVTQLGLGRKKGLSIGSILVIISLFGLIVGIMTKISLIASISILMFIISFGAGLGSNLSVFMAEILPPYGLGVAMSCQFLVSSIIGKLSPFAVRIFGVVAVLGFFIFCCFVMLIYIQVACKETKGLSEEEITELYLVKKNTKK